VGHFGGAEPPKPLETPYFVDGIQRSYGRAIVMQSFRKKLRWNSIKQAALLRNAKNPKIPKKIRQKFRERSAMTSFGT